MLGVLAGLAVGGAFKHHFPLALPSSSRNSLLRALLGNAGLIGVRSEPANPTLSLIHI